jgi:hypothetical protein
VATLHELGRPFSDAEGPGLLAGLRFDADNTLADTPMVGLLAALGGLLDAARERASGGDCPISHKYRLHMIVHALGDGPICV